MFEQIRKSLNGRALRWLQVAAIASLSVQVILAQGPGFNTTVPSQIMDQFRNQRILWTTNVWVYANTLFGILAVIEFAWSAAVMLLEKSDLQSWTSALIRKLMWIGAFYALLLNGRIWIPAIIDSFTQIGQNAAGLGALSPSGVFIQGLSLAGALLDGASTSNFFSNPGASLALAFAALIIVVSYTLITINFIVTLVESYLVVSVGFIFLGFGGSRWTAPYTERYIGLAVSIGIKILLLYCLISAGFGLSLGWIDEAQSIAASARPVMTAFDVMGGSLIFMMCCWQIPETVRGSDRRISGFDWWRSRRDRCRCRRCALCSGWGRSRRSERIGRRRQCSSGHWISRERWRCGLQHDNGGCGCWLRRIGFVSRRRFSVSAVALFGGFRRERWRRAQTARPAVKRLRRGWRSRRSANRHVGPWNTFARRKRIERERGPTVASICCVSLVVNRRRAAGRFRVRDASGSAGLCAGIG